VSTWPVVFYNVQRLLAVTGSPIARALDATAANGWTAAAYKTKVARLGAVLRDAAGGNPPAVLVLVEVEDAKGVADVMTAAGWGHMAIVAPAGEQVSGWDVAIAYDPGAFPGGVTRSESHVFNNRFNTRDLLVARLSGGSGRELVVMATHWPSRKVSDAQPERYAAAAYCDSVVESTLKYLKQDLLTATGRPRLPGIADLLARWLTPVLIAGDLNDEPWDASVRALASATPVRKAVTSAPTMPRGSTLRSVTAYLSRTPRLFNPTWALDQNRPTPATYYYDSNWHRIDQMLVSAGMLTTARPHFIDGSLRVHDVRTVTVAGNTVEVTTASGYPIPFDPKAMRGVSDHLPLVADIEI
jgi:endonuclease/exonuclease/phosphatase family metal-dependent hydrolase